MYAAGSNSCAQLGIGGYDDFSRLVQCRTRTGLFPPAGQVVQLASNSRGTIAIVRDGHKLSLWTCGMMLGNSDTFEEVAISTLISAVSCVGDYAPVHITAAWDCAHVVLRSADQKNDLIIAIGSHNEFGQLGIGNEPRPTQNVHLVILPCKQVHVTRIAAGMRHIAVAVASSDGQNIVYGWGDARRGQLGTLPPTVRTAQGISRVVHWSPVITTSSTHCVAALALGRCNTLVAWDTQPVTVQVFGAAEFDFDRTPDGLYVVPSFSALGCCWNTAICIAGSPPKVHATGLNNHFQCSGNGITVEQPILACGTEHVLVASDKLLAWGWNEHGNLAQGNTEAYDIPVCIMDQRVCSVFAGCGSSFVQCNAI